MKFNSILSILALSVATKVYADCFATELGYPCCNQTTDVVSVDSDGQWGIENGVKCGIEAVENVESRYFEKRAKTTDWSHYMDKINIEEFCPEEIKEAKEGVTYGIIDRPTYHSTTTQSTRTAVVIKPPNYNPNKKYPLLFLLHGIMMTGEFMLHPDFAVQNMIGNLINEKKAKEMIIVCPDQYAPFPGTEIEPVFNQEYFSGYDNFINDLTNDLLPFLYENYSIAKGRENTAICGYSYGGRNSVYIGFSRPDLFGYIGAFSPAPGLLPGDDALTGHHNGLYQEDTFRTDIQPIINLISCGTEDSVVTDFPKHYHEVLKNNKQDHIYYEISGTDHTDSPTVTSPLYNFLKSVFGQLNKDSNTKAKNKTTKIKKIKTAKVKKTKTTKVKKTKTSKVKKVKTGTTKKVVKIKLY